MLFGHSYDRQRSIVVPMAVILAAALALVPVGAIFVSRTNKECPTSDGPDSPCVQEQQKRRSIGIALLVVGCMSLLAFIVVPFILKRAFEIPEPPSFPRGPKGGWRKPTSEWFRAQREHFNNQMSIGGVWFNSLFYLAPIIGLVLLPIGAVLVAKNPPCEPTVSDEACDPQKRQIGIGLLTMGSVGMAGTVGVIIFLLIALWSFNDPPDL